MQYALSLLSASIQIEHLHGTAMRGLVGLGDLGDEDEFFFLHSVQSQFSLGIDFNDGDTQLRWHVLLHESQHSKSRKEGGKVK